ncbi:hypothetical protein ACJMK2_028613 [Sinanodonta woodiana]|uniref:Uncharacterized protein n=1 Tax=Sinanodonta woodiana TaxID=1069815 RepID=A0ABD3X9K9_SINWO
MFDVWHVAKGSKAHTEVKKVVKGRLLATDIKKLSPAEQTSSLESFHRALSCNIAFLMRL